MISRIPADREVFEKLIAKADVYIQNFRPGAATRLGAGLDRLHKINPLINICVHQRLRLKRSVH